jgi:hypothetical protein
MTDTDSPGDPPPAAVAQALYDRRDGRLALEVADANAADLTRPHRANSFTAYWVRAGREAFRADDARHPPRPARHPGRGGGAEGGGVRATAPGPAAGAAGTLLPRVVVPAARDHRPARRPDPRVTA